MVRVGTTVLTAIPPHPAKVSLAELLRVTGIAADPVKAALERLSARGLIVHAGFAQYQRTQMGDRVVESGTPIRPGPKRPGIDAGGKASPRPLRRDRAKGTDTLRDRVWRALRRLRKATLPELLELASREERDAVSNARSYLTALARHGVVQRLGRREAGLSPTSNGHIKYLLLRDLGPKSPLWQKRAGKLLDRNAGEIIVAEKTR